MNSILLRLLGGVNFAELLLILYKAGGENAVRRFVTTPEKFVRRICARTGADPEKAIKERDEYVDEIMEFVESLTEKDFEDPDPED